MFQDEQYWRCAYYDTHQLGSKLTNSPKFSMFKEKADRNSKKLVHQNRQKWHVQKSQTVIIRLKKEQD